MAATLTYDDLKAKTIADLRQLASNLQHPAVQGFTQMNKEHLLKALCTAVGIEMHHHITVVGVDKTDIKAHIRMLKTKRDEALAAHDAEQLHTIRRAIHHYKREIHKATVLD
jgi:DNA-binding IclR family transcriptional regulator